MRFCCSFCHVEVRTAAIVRNEPKRRPRTGLVVRETKLRGAGAGGLRIEDKGTCYRPAVCIENFQPSLFAQLGDTLQHPVNGKVLVRPRKQRGAQHVMLRQTVHDLTLNKRFPATELGELAVRTGNGVESCFPTIH